MGGGGFAVVSLWRLVKEATRREAAKAAEQQILAQRLGSKMARSALGSRRFGG